MSFYDENDEVKYKGTRRYAIDRGKGRSGEYGNKEKARHLRKPQPRTPFEISMGTHCICNCKIDCFRRELRHLCIYFNLDGKSNLVKAYNELSNN